MLPSQSVPFQGNIPQTVRERIARAGARPRPRHQKPPPPVEADPLELLLARIQEWLFHTRGIPTREQPHLAPPWEAVNIEAGDIGRGLLTSTSEDRTVTLPGGWVGVITHLAWVAMNDLSFPIDEHLLITSPALEWSLIVGGNAVPPFNRLNYPTGVDSYLFNNRGGMDADVPRVGCMVAEPKPLPAPIIIEPVSGDRDVGIRTNNSSATIQYDYSWRMRGFRFPERFKQWDRVRER